MDSINRFLNDLPPVLVAILLLILAFVVAWIAQKIAVSVLRRLRVDERFGSKGVQDTSSGSTAVFLGKLVFLIVFLLFLPGALDKLNMPSVSAPITGMVGAITSFLPRLIAAGIIVFIGLMVAKVLSQVVEALLRRVNIDRLQRKLGVNANQGSLAAIVAKVVYGLVLLLVVVAALQVLDIKAISDPATSMLNRIFEFLPNLVVAIAVIVIGVFLANLVGRLVTDILAGLGADSWLAKLWPQSTTDAPPPAPKAADVTQPVTGEVTGAAPLAGRPAFSLSKLAGTVVRVLIIIVFAVEGLKLLRLEILERVGGAVIGYLPSVFGAALVLALAVLAGNWVEGLIKRSRTSASYAVAAKVGILILGVFMALNQLQLSKEIVTWGFLLLLGAAAVAFAISFGIGGRTFAANRLQKLETKLDEPAVERPRHGSDSL